MYKANMHITPGKVRARVCELLEKEHMELIHLANESVLAEYDRVFVMIADEIVPKTYSKNRSLVRFDSYSVRCYDSETDTLFRGIYHLTYADALIKMGEIINE